jgi:hypothetical protein
MDQRWALLRPGARARLAGLWLARVSIAVSVVLVGARSMDIPIGLPVTGDLPAERPLTIGPARPPSVGQDPSLIAPLQLPPPPAAMPGTAGQPAVVGVLVPFPVSEALSGQPARKPARRLLAPVTRHRQAPAPPPQGVPSTPGPVTRAPTLGPPAPSPSRARISAPPPSPVPPPAAKPTPAAPPSSSPSPASATPSPPPGQARLVSPPQYRSEARTILSSSGCPTSRGQPLSSRSCFRVPSTSAPTSASS